MIPNRTGRDTERTGTTTEQGISFRLARLRLEQSLLPRLNTQDRLPLSTVRNPGLMVLEPIGLGNSSNFATSSGRGRGTVGMTPSWRARTRVKGNLGLGGPPRRDDEAVIVKLRRKILATLEFSTERAEGERRGTTSMKHLLLRIVAVDLAREKRYLTFLPLLPNHLRIELMEISTLWAPLDERALVVLLFQQQEEEQVGPQMISIDKSTEEEGEEEEEDEWFQRHRAPTALSFPYSLTTLNLSFTSLTLPLLTSLLLSPSLSPSHSSSSHSHSLFPHLTSLSLCSTPALLLSQSLFILLAKLTALKSLALAHKSSPTPFNSISTSLSSTPQNGLARLAIATPYLTSLDISFPLPSPSSTSFRLRGGGAEEGEEEESWTERMAGKMDWRIYWPLLVTLGWRSNLSPSISFSPSSTSTFKGEEEAREKERERIWGIVNGRRDLKGVGGGGGKGRAWIDIIV